MFKIEMAENQLDIELLFETCQVFGERLIEDIMVRPNASIMFSDDNYVMRFVDKIIPYSEIDSYAVVGSRKMKSYTRTMGRGVISRAITGGLIAGEVGAIVGAASAASDAQTTYYESEDGFYIRIFTKDGSGHQIHVRSNAVFSNKLHKDWYELFFKLDNIIEAYRD